MLVYTRICLVREGELCPKKQVCIGWTHRNIPFLQITLT